MWKRKVKKMRLIDADALKEKRFRMHSEFLGTVSVVAVKDIDDAPTIDPESLRKKGEWKPRTDVVGFVNCSVCHECNIYDDWADGKKWNFCPNCGADMRGEDDG